MIIWVENKQRSKNLMQKILFFSERDDLEMEVSIYNIAAMNTCSVCTGANSFTTYGNLNMNTNVMYCS